MIRRRLGLLAGVALIVGLLAPPASAAPMPANPYAAACRATPTVVSHRPAAGVVGVVAAPSALPPTPLIVTVLYQGSKPSVPRRPAGFAGPIPPQRCQVVRLAVVRVIGGTPPPQLVVVKPRAPYALRASRTTHAGTFLIDHATPYPTILGNYGPDPYDPNAVSSAVAAAGPR